MTPLPITEHKALLTTTPSIPVGRPRSPRKRRQQPVPAAVKGWRVSTRVRPKGGYVETVTAGNTLYRGRWLLQVAPGRAGRLKP